MGWLSGPAPKALTAVLVAQAALFYGLSRGEPAVFSTSLSQFPSQIDDWRTVREGTLEQDVKDTLRADDYLLRNFAGPGGESASLFVAFFKSQRAGQTPHSPKNCLPGAGWIWSVSDAIPISIEGRASAIEVNRYIVSKGDDRAVVLYWYQSRDRVVASEYRAAAFTAWDALRYNRTETALVRVVVPIAKDQDDAGTRAGVAFVRAFFSRLRQFFPR